MNRLRPTLAALGLLLTVACGDTESTVPVERTAVRDSAGIRIVDNDPTGLVPITVGGTPLLEIGSLDGGADELYQVTALVRGPDGRWFVANSGTNQVLIFDADGAPVGSFGGEGEGPGEFTSMSTLFMLGPDSLLAWDFRQRRASVFDLDGTLGRTFTPQPVEGQSSGSPVGVLSSGVLLAAGASTFGGNGEMQDGTLMRPLSTPSIVDAEGVPVATLDPIRGQEMWLNMGVDFVSVMEVPFAKTSNTREVGGRALLSESEVTRFDVFDATGSLVESWRIGIEPPDVTDADWNAAVDAIVGRYPDAAAASDARETYDAMTRPARHPAWESLHSGADGLLWVQEFDPPGGEEFNRWWRLDATGALVDRVDLPVGFVPRWSDATTVAGIVRDEFDVEYMRVYRIGG